MDSITEHSATEVIGLRWMIGRTLHCLVGALNDRFAKPRALAQSIQSSDSPEQALVALLTFDFIFITLIYDIEICESNP